MGAADAGFYEYELDRYMEGKEADPPKYPTNPYGTSEAQR